MMHNRIAVGYDGSPAAQYALTWAVHEAMGRGAIVLLVTAWPAAARSTGHDPDALADERLRLHRMQRRGVAEAIAGLVRPPVVAREIILSEPVTALLHAARFADIVVVGTDTAEALRPGSIATVLARRLSRRKRGGPAPVVVVATTTQAAVLPHVESPVAARTVEPVAA
jgi:hypothetical protein